MLDRLIAGYCTVLNYLLAIALALMVVLVFGNVVLRYAFNSGISLSEELSRWLFVWMTFLGAITALGDRAHLGTDMLVGRLGRRGKQLCLALAYLAMLGVCWLVFRGALEQTRINWETTSAVMEVSMAWFYASGMVFAVLGALVVLRDLLRLLGGQLQDHELLAIQESEEQAHDAQR